MPLDFLLSEISRLFSVKSLTTISKAKKLHICDQILRLLTSVSLKYDKTYFLLPQEIGRAGRDGLEAHCHLFLDTGGGGGSRDLNELRRHIHSNSVDAHTIRKLLTIVFNQDGEGDGGGAKQVT